MIDRERKRERERESLENIYVYIILHFLRVLLSLLSLFISIYLSIYLPSIPLSLSLSLFPSLSPLYFYLSLSLPNTCITIVLSFISSPYHRIITSNQLLLWELKFKYRCLHMVAEIHQDICGSVVVRMLEIYYTNSLVD